MKKSLLAILIAAIAGVTGYYLGKTDFFSKLTPPSLDTPSKVETSHSAEVIFQINPIHGHHHSATNTQLMSRRFFQTQFNIIKSNATITKAIQDYQLVELTGIDEAKLLKAISENIEAALEIGTNLVVITISSETEKIAQQICYAIIKSYAETRKKDLIERNNETLYRFKVKEKEQGNRVEVHRKALYEMSKKLGIPYYGVGSKLNGSAELGRDKNPVEVTKFGEAKDNYEKEMRILEAIKNASLEARIMDGLDSKSVIIHSATWPDELPSMMQARKKQ